jgi:radial spoke head protein 4A
MTEEVKVNDSVAPPEVPAAFQEAKEYLRGVPGSGVSVYDHLTQVLVKLLDERPPDANALFEEVSSSVRDMTITEAPKPPTEQQLVRTGGRVAIL